MRVLLSTIGSRGDVQPLVALALKLRDLECGVRLCVPPDFCDWIASFGLDVVPIGPEVRTFATTATGTPPAPPSPERVRQLVEQTVATQFETISRAAGECDAIVAATALQVAARSVSETLGVPYVFAAYSPAVLPSAHHAPPPLPPRGEALPATTDNRELWARDAQRFNATFLAPLNRHRVAAGLSAIDDVRSHMFTNRPWLAADPVLGPWPEPGEGGVFQTGAWILPDDRPLPADVEVFLGAGAPPVYFGFGSTQAQPETGRALLRAARTLGRRAIVSRGWADLPLADAGTDCLEVGEVNLKRLFTRVAAAVHHGGAGTTTLAALAGVPQVLVPHLYDQHYWALQVDRLGIGAAHPAVTPTSESLKSALEPVLRPEVAVRARGVAGQMRSDGALVAARRVLAVAGV